MSRYVFKMPDLGEGTVSAEVVAWHVKPGDLVHEDQVMCEVMTEKAAVEMPAPVTGAGISTAAFSVMTSHITWSSCTRSPGLTCQATTSAETVPSPRSGILNT